MISQKYLKMLEDDKDGQLERMLSRRKESIIGEAELNEVQIIDCGEPLVRITDYVDGALIAMTEMRKRFPNEDLYARESVVKQLSEVARTVYPNRLKFFDAFRPIELQQKWFDDIYTEVRQKNQTWNDEQVRAEAFVYVFPPSWDLQTPPPHSTGAALDLTLTDKDGRELDMGTKYAEFDSPLMYTNAQGLNAEQRANRVSLVTSMAKSGFVNYPGEWWHFSFGDREWVAYLGKTDLPAIFSRAEDPR